MSINSYPILLISRDELVFIEDEEQLENEIFHLDSNELKEATVITKAGCYFSLMGEIKPAYDLHQLSRLVQHALLLDGHCCVEKIQLSNIVEAFQLFTVDQGAQMCSNTAAKR